MVVSCNDVPSNRGSRTWLRGRSRLGPTSRPSYSTTPRFRDRTASPPPRLDRRPRDRRLSIMPEGRAVMSWVDFFSLFANGPNSIPIPGGRIFRSIHIRWHTKPIWSRAIDVGNKLGLITGRGWWEGVGVRHVSGCFFFCEGVPRPLTTKPLRLQPSLDLFHLVLFLFYDTAGRPQNWEFLDVPPSHKPPLKASCSTELPFTCYSFPK